MIRIGILLLLASVFLHGQVPTAPRRLTLDEARRLAAQRNPRLASARFGAQAAHQTPLEVRSALLPTLTGLATGVGADSGSRLAAGGLNNPAVYSRLASGVVASQLITDFGRTRALVSSAELNAQSQDEQARSVQADVALATIRAYFGVLRANSVLRVARQTVSARQAVADQVDALFQNRIKSQLDVSFANVNLAEARLLLSQAEGAVKASESILANVIGLPGVTSFDLTEPADDASLPSDVNALLASALAERPDLKALRLAQGSAERIAAAEHALNYPVIAAQGTTGIVPVGEASLPGRYGAAGINVTIPIFNGGLYRARQAEAELKAKAASSRVTDAENQITQDVRIAWLNAQTSSERVTLAQQLLTQSRQALDLAQGRYDLGLGSIVELSQAQLAETSAEIQGTTAKYDFQSALAILQYQAGSLR